MIKKLHTQKAFTLIRKSYHREHAFTLIEMLVVISIIGILAAMALVSFSSVQKQARDTTRKSDLKQYQTAAESFASKNNGLYPNYTAVTTIPSSGGICTDFNIGTCQLDPKNTSPYLYKYITDAGRINYVIWGGLEKSSTTTYWVICSNGKNGEVASAPTTSACPL